MITTFDQYFHPLNKFITQHFNCSIALAFMTVTDTPASLATLLSIILLIFQTKHGFHSFYGIAFYSLHYQCVTLSVHSTLLGRSLLSVCTLIWHLCTCFSLLVLFCSVLFNHLPEIISFVWVGPRHSDVELERCPDAHNHCMQRCKDYSNRVMCYINRETHHIIGSVDLQGFFFF